MTSVRIHSSITLMILILASCAQPTSTKMTGANAQETQGQPEVYNATAASDVDSKGGLTGERPPR